MALESVWWLGGVLCPAGAGVAGEVRQATEVQCFPASEPRLHVIHSSKIESSVIIETSRSPGNPHGKIRGSPGVGIFSLSQVVRDIVVRF